MLYGSILSDQYLNRNQLYLFSALVYYWHQIQDISLEFDASCDSPLSIIVRIAISSGATRACLIGSNGSGTHRLGQAR